MILLNCLWTISGADVILNGSHRKQNVPIVVLKFVSFWLAASKEICQNLQEVSRVEYTLAPASLGVISSNAGRMYLSCLAALFKYFRSVHMCTYSWFFFSTGTIGAHQSEDIGTWSLMPADCGHWYGVVSESGSHSAFSWIFTGLILSRTIS